MPNEPETTIVFRLHTRPGAPFHAQPSSSGRLPRVTQVMALALSFQQMLHTGEAPSYAALARTAGVTRERFSQVMKLLWLAPDIQQEILELPSCFGNHPLTEYALRGILRHLSWADQRRGWCALKATLFLK